MVEYFREEELESAKAQKKKTLTIYFIVVGVYLIIGALIFAKYLTLPYSGWKDTKRYITRIKLIEYPITAVFVIFSLVYLNIRYRRVRRYYLQCLHLATGLRETSEGSFICYDESLQDKDGVDMKSLVFLEWNKYKNDYFERKVLVFNEKPYPKIEESAVVKYVTQGNVLVEYEIMENK